MSKLRRFCFGVVCSLPLAATALIAPADVRADDIQQVYFDAIIANSGEPLETSGELKIWSMRDDSNGRLVGIYDRFPALAELEPGHYRVQARVREATRVQDFTITPDSEDRQVINMDAGITNMMMMHHAGGPQVDEPISWRVVTYGRNGDGERDEIAHVYGSTVEMLLPEGHYVVEARYREAAINHTIEVDAGRTYNYMVNLNAGRIDVSALSGGNRVDGVTWEVYSVRDGAAGETPVASISDDSDGILLREGSYRLVGRAGGMLGETDFSLAPGETREVRVSLR